MPSNMFSVTDSDKIDTRTDTQADTLSEKPMEKRSGPFSEMKPTPDMILSAWELNSEQGAEVKRLEAATGYPMEVSQHFTKCAMTARDGALRKQVLPSEEELLENVYFTTNPLKEQAPVAKNFSPIFLLQKYSGRALLMTATECFGNCRFCFRRHLRTNFPSKNLRPEHYETPLFQLSNDTSIHEIILSGGDPLTLEDGLFFWLLEQIKNIEHIKRIRVHTRALVFSPEKISENFLEFLKNFSKKSSKPLYFVLHVNHPDELSPEMLASAIALHRAGVTLLQQGVLLRGVNDDVEILAELYEKLSEYHIIPYYLHQLDRVAGASHFEVSEETGRKLITDLRSRLPGFAVPRYVREIPGEPGKTPLD
ncbi:MAG: KamA family radical SAM protein [Planctomycetia bacterium]|nr:KamA family radical SAM protein [Planctomycetia bacterium]